jgi:hypothetical protein
MSNTNLVSASLTRPPVARITQRTRRGAERQDDRHAQNESQQVPVVVNEQDTEREHGAEVRDEAGGQDDLAQGGLVESGFHHHRVDDRHRRRRQGDACDLGRTHVPAHHPAGKSHCAQERQQKAEETDRQRLLPVIADDRRVDLGSGQEGQQAAAEAGQEVDPSRGLHVEQVARHDADDDLPACGGRFAPEDAGGLHRPLGTTGLE